MLRLCKRDSIGIPEPVGRKFSICLSHKHFHADRDPIRLVNFLRLTDLLGSEPSTTRKYETEMWRNIAWKIECKEKEKSISCNFEEHSSLVKKQLGKEPFNFDNLSYDQIQSQKRYFWERRIDFQKGYIKGKKKRWFDSRGWGLFLRRDTFIFSPYIAWAFCCLSFCVPAFFHFVGCIACDGWTFWRFRCPDRSAHHRGERTMSGSGKCRGASQKVSGNDRFNSCRRCWLCSVTVYRWSPKYRPQGGFRLLLRFVWRYVCWFSRFLLLFIFWLLLYFVSFRWQFWVLHR